MNEFQSFVEEEIKKKFIEKNIVIWFDKDNVFSRIFDKIEINAKKMKFEGSFLKLRFQVYTEDPNFEKKWLFYVPLPEEDCDWLREITVLAALYTDDFEMIYKKLGYELSPENKEFIKKNAVAIAENPEKYPLKKNIKKDDELIKEHMFVGLFKESVFDIKNMVLKFINDEEFDEDLEKYKLEFISLICNKLGEKNIKANSLKELRENLIRTSFFSEFYSNKEEKDNFNFKDLLPEEAKVPLFTQIIELWQKNTDYKDKFAKESEETEQKYNSLLLDIYNYNDVLKVSSFRAIDEYLFDKINTKFEKGSIQINKIFDESEELFNIINTRKQLFWAKEDKKNHWVLIEKALNVIIISNDALTNISPTATKEDLIKSYVAEYWKIDCAYREFTTLAVDNQHKIEDVKFLVETYYTKFLQKINRSFSETHSHLVAWSEKDIPLQTSFWKEIIEQLPKEEIVAIIIVDALRYELAKELQDKLKEFKTTLKPFITILPSITEVGMAAILPHKKMEFVESADQFRVKIDNQIIKDKSDRKKIILNALPETIFFNLNDIESLHSSEIKKKIKNKNRLFLFSNEIDSMGENVEDISLSTFSLSIGKIYSAILKLKQSGIKKFIVITDHGFIFTSELKEEDKVEIPSGKIIYKSRRFVIGRNLESSQGVKINPLKENIESDLEMAFPFGTSCFKSAGGTRFNHGGASLQEVVIPCLIIESTAESNKQQLNIKVTYPESIVNSIFKIEISPKFETIQDMKGRTLEITIQKNEVEVAAPVYCEIENNTINQLLKLNPTITTGVVKIKVMDFDTKETLSQKEISLNFMYSNTDF